ncbi:hypothetical protein Lrub_0325 [Legionella rubrilucens]|uniref:Uncharacterized protein n=1 Tax=Legionella rubrilucens TaxID=458 RepID=A0A0W0XYS0_9GAMM|nr:hypothetical protein [Legionella rubrilucens]KTD49883.1 hypothetical protein Lrub_0325 [Legionella rubrilucens]
MVDKSGVFATIAAKPSVSSPAEGRMQGAPYLPERSGLTIAVNLAKPGLGAWLVFTG